MAELRHPGLTSLLRRLTRSAALGVLGALTVACSGEHSEPGGPASEAPADLRTVTLSPEVRPLERRLDGVVEAVNQATVSAETSGRVAEIFYDVDDFVPAGSVIMRLRGTEQRATLRQAESALREATAREAEAQSQYKRIAEIYAQGLVPKATLDEALANRDTAVARLEAARAAVTAAREGVGYTEIRAPYSGVVTKRHVEVGEAVSPGSPLMTGLSLKDLRVSVDIPQTIIDEVRKFREAAVYVDGRRIEATHVTIFPTAAAPSNTFRVRVNLPENAADLYPGMFVKVGFTIGEAERLLIPAEALVERSEVRAVYVLDPQGHTSLRQIRTGHRFNDQIEVLAGLRAGEKVALDPVKAARYLARPGESDHG